GPGQAGREAATACGHTQGLESFRSTGLAYRTSLSREDSASPLGGYRTGLSIGPGHLRTLRCGDPRLSILAASTALADSCATCRVRVALRLCGGFLVGNYAA